MFELIANMIVYVTLGGTLLILAIVILKTVIALVASVSTTLSEPAVVSVPHCRYCGQVFLGSEVKCEHCGAVRQ
jgi:hypothetical protein